MTLGRQISATFIAKLISFFFTFIANVFLTRMLGVEGKGLYAFILLNASLFTIIFGLNVTETLTYFVAKSGFDKAATRGFVLLLNLVGIVLFGIILMVLFASDSPVLSFILPEGYQSVFYVVFLWIIFINSISEKFFNGNWQGQAKFEIINAIVLSTSILSAVVYFVVWYLQHAGMIALSLQEILTVSLVLTVLFFLTRLGFYAFGKNPVSFRVRQVIRPILIFSGVGWITILMNFAVKRIDFWFVEKFKGIDSLGHYALAAGLADTLVVLLLPATAVISPYITRADEKKREALLGRFSRITIVFVVAMVLMAFPFIKPVLPILYGMEFIQAVYPLQILIFGIMMLIIRNIFTVFNIATNNLKVNFYGILISLVVTLVLDILLIPKYGIAGAAWASFFAYMSSTVFIIITVMRKLEQPFGYFLFFNRGDYEFLKVKLKAVLSR